MKELDYVSTLSGYIHWKLTGNRVIGIGDAAGMFPVNSGTHDYCEDMVQKFDTLTENIIYSWKLERYFSKGTCSG